MTADPRTSVAKEDAVPHAAAVWAVLVASGIVTEDFVAADVTSGPAQSTKPRTAERMLADEFAPPSLVFDGTGTISRLINLRPHAARLESPGPEIRLWGEALLDAATRSPSRRLPPLTCSVDGTLASVTANVFRTDDGGALVAFERAVEGPLGLEATREALREQTLFLDAIVEHIPNMLFVKDAAELRFVRFNRAGEELLGFDRADLLGRNDHDLFPAEEADFFTQKDRDVLVSGRMLEIDDEPIHTASGTRYLHTKKVPLLDPVTGAPKYLLGISEDITERRLAEQAIRAAGNAAMEANAAKSHFLANMSHELRTPLTAILGYAEMLREDASDSSTTHDLTQIVSAASHLLDLISGILDLSKVEAGRMELNPEPVDVRNLVRTIEQTLRPQSNKKGNTFVVEVQSDVPRQIEVDKLRLRQCLLNLASNATKFTDDGEVRIDVSCEDAQLRFDVRDTGTGMSQEHVDQVFEPFFQADMSRTRRHDGTGLGLTITKRITDLMSANLSVESELGEGTTFTLTLPLDSPATSTEA